jgi:uncharacterized GH25 family protein
MADTQPISGVVLDPDGRPVLGARVYVTASPAPIPDVAILSGPDGEFVLGADAPGIYRLAASADGYRTAEAEIDTSNPWNVELRLQHES